VAQKVVTYKTMMADMADLMEDMRKVTGKCPARRVARKASGGRRRSGNRAEPAPRLSDRAQGQDERRKGPAGLPICGDEIRLQPKRQLLVQALKKKPQVRKAAKSSPQGGKIKSAGRQKQLYRAAKLSPQGGKIKPAGRQKPK
jgi:hypothetical protein